MAVQGYALHLGEFGLRSVVTAAAARTPGRFGRLLLRYLGLRLAISLTLVVAIGAAGWLYAPDLAPVLLLATASILATALQLDWVALADDRPVLAAALLLVRPAAFLALLLAAAGPLTLTHVGGCFLDAWLLAAVLSWSALRRPYPREMARDVGVPDAAGLLRAGAPVRRHRPQPGAAERRPAAGRRLLRAGDRGHYYVATQVATSGLVLANASGQSALARLARHKPDLPAFAAELWWRRRARWPPAAPCWPRPSSPWRRPSCRSWSARPTPARSRCC